MTRILLTGKTCQVGYELERNLQGLCENITLDRSQMDHANQAQVRDVIRPIKPDLIINPAAYTAVDKAESEPELAMRIKAEEPGVMAEEAKKLGAAMIHYSTDYVFDGSKTTPYLETDPTCPINVYGATKLAGEQAIQGAGIPHLILRTSWVYGMRGNNFLSIILQLAQEREELRIVADQHGAPIWCRTIADTTAHIVAQGRSAQDPQEWWQQRSGIYNLTAQGQNTWHGLTQSILGNSTLVRKPFMSPIATQDYPLQAKRPMYSILSPQKLADTFQICTPEWNKALACCQAEQ